MALPEMFGDVFQGYVSCLVSAKEEGQELRFKEALCEWGIGSASGEESKFK